MLFLYFRAGKKRGRNLIILAIIVGGMALFPFVWHGWIQARYASSIYTLDEAQVHMPAQQVAIVFGARVYRNGHLSGMTRDRVDTAIRLYEAGIVEKLLISGDNRFVDYNEPGEMMAYAIARGIPAEAIQPDYGGRRTYDTCYRAHHIFQIDSAILITQQFHLPRALFLCSNLDIEVLGVQADLQTYSQNALAWSESREVPALLIALFDIIRQVPPPVLGDPIPIE